MLDKSVRKVFMMYARPKHSPQMYPGWCRLLKRKHKKASRQAGKRICRQIAD